MLARRTALALAFGLAASIPLAAPASAEDAVALTGALTAVESGDWAGAAAQARA